MFTADFDRGRQFVDAFLLLPCSTLCFGKCGGVKAGCPGREGELANLEILDHRGRAGENDFSGDRIRYSDNRIFRANEGELRRHSNFIQRMQAGVRSGGVGEREKFCEVGARNILRWRLRFGLSQERADGAGQ